VVRSRIGVATLVVLSAYGRGRVCWIPCIFRLKLDRADESGEVRYAPEVLSLLDLALSGLRERQEKTYSAPFATHLHAKEAHRSARWDGDPRLSHVCNMAGAHLADPERDRAWDITWRSLVGLIKGAEPLGTARRWSHRVAGASSRAAIRRGYHLLGTDKVGQDVFYQALKSIRTGLLIGTLTTLVMLPAAILLGIMAGYFRGWVDDVIQYLYTTLNSIPGVLLIAAAILLLQVYMNTHADDFNSLEERADLRLLFLCLILGVTSWTGLCRLLRGEALKLREQDYVQAAVAFGVGHFRILGRHILPNVLHIVLITVVLDFSGLVLAEAVLSYVNIGVDPSTNSWGNMINSARLELAREPVVWWSLAAAFFFMFTLVLAANLFADAVRDAFDPRLRGGR
jgi:peptide/nickel transport system permease protein